MIRLKIKNIFNKEIGINYVTWMWMFLFCYAELAIDSDGLKLKLRIKLLSQVTLIIYRSKQ